MFCANCGKKLENDSKFCPYCGTEVLTARKMKEDKEEILQGVFIPRENAKEVVSRAPDLQKAGSGEIDSLAFEHVPPAISDCEFPTEILKQKRGKVRPLPIFITLLIVSALFSIYFSVWYFDPQQQLSRALESNDCMAVREAFDKANGSYPAADSINNWAYEKVEKYNRGEIEYQEAAEHITMLESAFWDTDLDLEQQKGYLNTLAESKRNFWDGAEMEAQGDLLSAIHLYDLVSWDDTYYGEAYNRRTDLIPQYREEMLAKAEKCASDGSYASAITILTDAQTVFPDDFREDEEINKLVSEYEQKAGEEGLSNEHTAISLLKLEPSSGYNYANNTLKIDIYKNYSYKTLSWSLDYGDITTEYYIGNDYNTFHASTLVLNNWTSDNFEGVLEIFVDEEKKYSGTFYKDSPPEEIEIDISEGTFLKIHMVQTQGLSGGFSIADPEFRT